MQFQKYQSRAHSDITVIPLINIIFLLLVFFMISGAMSGRFSYDVNLPNVSVDDTTLSPANLVLTADGNTRWGEFAGEQALQKSVAMHNASDGRVFSVYADKNISAARVAEILRYLAKQKVEQVNLVVEDK